MFLEVDEKFIKKYNPQLPLWSDAKFFAGTLLQKRNKISGNACEKCRDCKDDLHQKLGFIVYHPQEDFWKQIIYSCNFMELKDNKYIGQFRMDCKPGNDYSNEIGTLIKIMQSLEELVVEALSQAACYPAMDKIIITNKTNF